MSEENGAIIVPVYYGNLGAFLPLQTALVTNWTDLICIVSMGMRNRFQTLIVYLAPVPYILYLTRWSARRHGRHGRQHNDQGEQATQSQYTQSISGRHQWRHHLPGHQSQGRASGLREYRIINLSYIAISALFQLFNCSSGNRPGVHGRSGQDQTSRQSFYWARPDTNGGRHERYFYKGFP